MKLVEPRWLVIGGAGLIALATPMLLLRETPEKVPIASSPASVVVQPRQSAELTFALTAPPFDPDRTPGSPAATTDPATPATPPPPMPKLVGLVVGGGGRSVALVKSASGETVTVAAGETVDSWRLVSVGREQAVFEQGGSRQVATLDFSNKPAADQTPSPANTSPPPPPAPLPTTSISPVPDRKQP